MSDYTKSTNFASKDSLSSGNPLKIVKGTELDTEFNNISTAVSTKADLASPAFTGTPTAPTAAAGTVSTQLATTAFAAQAAYPVGSVYLNASDSTNPATLFGFGTWVALGAGKMLVGYQSGDSLFGTAGNTGGSRDAITVAHTHTGTTASNGDHQHDSSWGESSTGPFGNSGRTGLGSGSTDSGNNGWLTSTAGAHTHTFTTDSTGSSGTNANLPPYLVVYMWKRTA